jgi:iron complex transport system substrate-binding protein
MTLDTFKKCLLLVCALMPAVAGISMAQNISVVDDDGHNVTLQQPAQRIISLAPSMTELLFSLDAGDRVVGVMDFSDYPAQARERPIVGRFDMLDMERILTLQPDLIVAWRSGNPRNSIQRLKELGFAVYIAEPDSLSSIVGQLARLGQLTGQTREAETLQLHFESALSTLQNNYSNRAPVSVFYQVWHSPIISVGGAELINDMIKLCGGNNIFSELPVGPKVNLEDVLVRDPQVIIASGSNQESPQWLNDWLQWPQLQAVKNKHLYAIAPDLVQRHSLRALRGAAIMCEHIARARP